MPRDLPLHCRPLADWVTASDEAIVRAMFQMPVPMCFVKWALLNRPEAMATWNTLCKTDAEAARARLRGSWDAYADACEKAVADIRPESWDVLRVEVPEETARAMAREFLAGNAPSAELPPVKNMKQLKRTREELDRIASIQRGKRLNWWQRLVAMLRPRGA